ncbi:hypothetical protein AC1031_002297 [Aphanomyces cochlioides]|nr:hypothetical protein AC1031_002286 [Aphanomyces cochlioides]KAG9407587.1 hypothetical protein AC1031_002297 [Aphanomyces cochlioides]
MSSNTINAEEPPHVVEEQPPLDETRHLTPVSPTWYTQEGEIRGPPGPPLSSYRGDPIRQSHGSGTPSEHGTTSGAQTVVTQSMLESKLDANNATLIRQLMSMMRKAEDANPSLPEDDGGPWDLEDEPAPVGVAEDRTRTLRLMPVEPLTIFDGEFSDRDTAGTWLRKFEETSYACQWSDEETRRRFRLYTTKYVQEWVSQLEGPQKRTWRQLRQSFMKEYVQSAIDQEDLYYCMYQKPHEKVRAYFVRHNAAALRIGVDYRKNRRHLDRHIDRFARTLYDRSLGMAISRQHFQSIVDLERFVDRMRKSEEIDEFMGKSYPLNRPTTATPMNSQDRTKAKKGNVQFIDTPYDRASMYESPPGISYDITS